jgi:ribonuclease P protein component
LDLGRKEVTLPEHLIFFLGILPDGKFMKSLYLAPPMEQRYTFSKNERLCLKKRIDSLFSSGRWLRSEHLRLVYLVGDEQLEAPAQIIFSIPKKLHRRAVKRNLLKRRLREAYRLNKPKFYANLGNSSGKLLLGIVYSSAEIADYKTLQTELSFLLIQTNTHLSRQ